MPYADPLVSKAKSVEYTRRHREKKAAVPGTCSTGCGKNTEGAFKKCAACREYMQEYKKGVRKGRPTTQNCRVCGKSTSSSKTRCSGCRVPVGKEHPHRSKYAQREKDHAAEVWAVALAHYGNKCACCSETRPLFLTIDHIGGEAHGSCKSNGAALCAWLIRNNFPEGFRVLCYNCNGSLGFRGYCPHGCLTQTRHGGRPTTRDRTLKEVEELRQRWLSLKTDVLTAYGGCACCCCGEPTIEFLSLDHLDNDGAAHRTQLFGKNYGKVSEMYAYLRRNNYPPLNLATTCFNCNMGRQRAPDKKCPHEHEIPLLVPTFAS